MSAFAKLPRRQQAFVDAFVKCGVGTMAIREIGFKGKYANYAAWRYMQMPTIKAAVKERTDEVIAAAGITKVGTLKQLAHAMHFDPRRLVDKDGNPLPLHKLSDETAAAIGGVEIEERVEGEGARRRTVRVHKYRLRSVEPVRLSMSYMRLLTDQHEHSGPAGGPIVTKEVGTPTDLDVARRISFALAQGMRALETNTAPADESDDEDESEPAGSR